MEDSRSLSNLRNSLSRRGRVGVGWEGILPWDGYESGIYVSTVAPPELPSPFMGLG
jgi:hypothetical protein